jgi:lipopolysaccharide transport protein LptA
MRNLGAGLVLLISGMVAAHLSAQSALSAAESPSPTAKKSEQKTTDKQEKSGVNKLLGPNPVGSTEPTTTEIYADEAFFDSNKNTGIFTGHVKVADPRFSLQSDKLTVFISKGENQGLEKAIAEGNVGVVRDRPDPNGGPPSRAVGRSETATYTAASGDVELKGTPRVQQGENTHVATSPDTVMIINQNGQLTTHGPSRTDIRQEPKEETKGETKPETKAQPSAKP